MIAPWRFMCENFHLLFDANLLDHGSLPHAAERLQLLPRSAEISHRYVLTVSIMRSTCNSESDFIESHEVILKAVVKLKAVQYYFPVFAVVDAPHSIVRGALLGYKKEIGEIHAKQGFTHFKTEGIDNHIRYEVCASDSEDVPLYPHLTYRNYCLPEFQANGLSALDITDYQASPILKCTCQDISLPFLQALGIQTFSGYKAGLIFDKFSVSGAHYV